MILRLADHRDEENLYLLSNDPEVRKHSFNIRPIPFNEHQDWFQKQLEDKNTLFLITYENDILVGQVRFKIIDKEAIASVSVSSLYRGKGYGEEMMRNALLFCKKNSGVSIVKAFIKADNTGSKKYFEKCGYKFIEQTIHNDVKTDIYAINICDD
jgi:UDP-2,4-diacetamido-2,4,6-trideoxy-beta-L-altropyranose hydrolase